MARRAPHRGYFVKVEATCDNLGICCVEAVAQKRRGEKICGMDYKLPWEDFSMTRDEIDHSGGWPVRKLVAKSSWEEMVDLWGEGSEGGGSQFFGRRRRRRRR